MWAREREEGGKWRGQVGEGRRGEPEASPLSSPGEAGEVVGVDLAPEQEGEGATGEGGVGRPAGPAGSGGPKPKWGRGFLSLCFSFFFLFFVFLFCLFHFKILRHFLKKCFLHNNYQCNIWHPPNIFVLTFENFGCLSLIHF